MSQISIRRTPQPGRLTDAQNHDQNAKACTTPAWKLGSVYRYPPTVFLNRILLVSSKRCDYFYSFQGWQYAADHVSLPSLGSGSAMRVIVLVIFVCHVPSLLSFISLVSQQTLALSLSICTKRSWSSFL